MKTINVRYGIDKMELQVNCDSTVRDILNTRRIKAGLGFGDNVVALQNGVKLPDSAIPSDATELVVETACNTKAQDLQEVTVRYGVDRITKAVPYGSTIADLKRNSTVRAALGYGDNIRMLLNGVAMPDSAVIPNGATVVVETACNTKATN